jgi:Undecaprenyl-phosphate glucose phosphotransferase
MIHNEITNKRPLRLSIRRNVDIFSFIVDLLFIWDVLAGLVTGEGALVLYSETAIDQMFYLDVTASFWQEITLGSVLAGVVLREPRLATDRKLFMPGRLLSIMQVRGAVGLALLLVVGLATRAIDDMECAWLLAWSAMFGLCVVLSRVAFVLYVRELIGIGALRKAIAIVTMAGAEGHLATRLAAEADVVLNVDAGDELETVLNDEAGIDGPFAPSGPIESILTLGRSGAIDSVVVAMSRGQNPALSKIVEQLKGVPVPVILCPDVNSNVDDPEGVRQLGGVAMAVVANRPIRAWNLLAKLLFDKLLSSVLLVIAAPIMLVIAAAIVIESPGPVVFRQRRSGWAGHRFVLLKFRTMREGDHGPVLQTRRRDPRCTRFGAFLRSTSLDELPQLINVLLGDMSLVGPRPHMDTLHADEIVSHAVVAEYAQRYRVKPGMTGWAQVNGYRGATTTAEQLRRRVEHDLFYIENWSLLFDIRILLLTPFTVLFRENAF